VLLHGSTEKVLQGNDIHVFRVTEITYLLQKIIVSVAKTRKSRNLAASLAITHFNENTRNCMLNSIHHYGTIAESVSEAPIIYLLLTEDSDGWNE